MTDDTVPPLSKTDLGLTPTPEVTAVAQTQQKKPNILIIWGDDIGMWNISAYHRGMLGGSTPNIDRIAKEGIKTQDRWFNGIQNTFTIPLVTNLKLDPFERFHEARGFDEWRENRAWLFGPAKMLTAQFFQTFKDYPSRQAASASTSTRWCGL